MKKGAMMTPEQFGAGLGALCVVLLAASVVWMALSGGRR